MTAYLVLLLVYLATTQSAAASFDPTKALDLIATAFQPSISSENATVTVLGHDIDDDDLNNAFYRLYIHYDSKYLTSTSGILPNLFIPGLFTPVSAGLDSAPVPPSVYRELSIWIRDQLQCPDLDLHRVEFCAALVYILTVWESDYVPAPLISSLMHIPDWDTSNRIIMYVTGAAVVRNRIQDEDLLHACADTLIARFKMTDTDLNPALITLWHRMLRRGTDAVTGAFVHDLIAGPVRRAYGVRLCSGLVDRDATRDQIRAVMGRLGVPDTDTDLVDDLYVEVKLFGLDADIDDLVDYVRGRYGRQVPGLMEDDDDDDDDHDDIWETVNETLPRLLHHVLPYQYSTFIPYFYRQYMAELLSINGFGCMDPVESDPVRLQRILLDRVLIIFHAHFMTHLIDYPHSYLPLFYRIRYCRPINQSDIETFLCTITLWVMNSSNRDRLPPATPITKEESSVVVKLILHLLRSKTKAAAGSKPSTLQRNLFQVATWATSMLTADDHVQVVQAQRTTLPLIVVRHPLWPQNPVRDLQLLARSRLSRDVVEFKDESGHNLITALVLHPSYDPAARNRDRDRFLGFLFAIMSDREREWTRRAIPDHAAMLEANRAKAWKEAICEVQCAMSRLWTCCVICHELIPVDLEMKCDGIRCGCFHIRDDGCLVHDYCL